MKLFFLFFIFSFQIEEPILEDIIYPKSELKLNIENRIVANLKVEMEIDEEGRVLKFSFLGSENIEKERIDHFFNFFKNQIWGKKVKHCIKDGKPVRCIYIYIFSWVLYYPPPEVHYQFYNGELKKEFIKTLKGDEKSRKEYEKELEGDALKILNKFGLKEEEDEEFKIYSNLNNLEIVFQELKSFKKFFFKYYKLKDEKKFPKQKIFLFPNKKTLNNFLEDNKLPQWADGLYIGALNLIFSLIPIEKKNKEVFLHEIAHFLINRVLFENKYLPIFLREGFAENLLYEYMNEKKEDLTRWEGYKSLIKRDKKNYGILSFLFFWDNLEKVKEKESQKFYAYSWAFIRYLKSKENYEDFVNFLKEEGFSKESLEIYYGSYLEIEEDFKDFLRKMIK